MTRKRLSALFLRSLRNEIPIDDLVTSILRLPCKYSENHLRFLCPLCSELHTATDQKTNLARCFRCQKSFNPIDLVMIVNNYGFIEAVRFLEPFLHSPEGFAHDESLFHKQR